MASLRITEQNLEVLPVNPDVTAPVAAGNSSNANVSGETDTARIEETDTKHVTKTVKDKMNEEKRLKDGSSINGNGSACSHNIPACAEPEMQQTEKPKCEQKNGKPVQPSFNNKQIIEKLSETEPKENATDKTGVLNRFVIKQGDDELSNMPGETLKRVKKYTLERGNGKVEKKESKKSSKSLFSRIFRSNSVKETEQK